MDQELFLIQQQVFVIILMQLVELNVVDQQQRLQVVVNRHQHHHFNKQLHLVHKQQRLHQFQQQQFQALLEMFVYKKDSLLMQRIVHVSIVVSPMGKVDIINMSSVVQQERFGIMILLLVVILHLVLGLSVLVQEVKVQEKMRGKVHHHNQFFLDILVNLVQVVLVV